MGAALEIVILPTILVTLLAFLMFQTSLGPAALLVTAVLLGFLYVAIVKHARTPSPRPL